MMKGGAMRFCTAVLLMWAVTAAGGASLTQLTNQDAVSGLKQALTDGAAAAVSKLGVENGFLGNAKVKIPLPESLRRVEGLMRAVGLQAQADELVTAMNRAAELAV